MLHLPFLLLALQNPASMPPDERARMEAQNAQLETMLETAEKLPLTADAVRHDVRDEP